MAAKEKRTAVNEPKLAAKAARPGKFDIRLSLQEEAVIKQAAGLLSTSPTNFIRQQAVVAAEAVVHEQTRFVVTQEQWELIEQALNAPPKVLANLQKQLARPDEWNS